MQQFMHKSSFLLSLWHETTCNDLEPVSSGCNRLISGGNVTPYSYMVLFSFSVKSFQKNVQFNIEILVAWSSIYFVTSLLLVK